MPGIPGSTCTSHPRNSASQPRESVKGRLLLNALSGEETTVIDYDLLRSDEKLKLGDEIFWMPSVYGRFLINI